MELPILDISHIIYYFFPKFLFYNKNGLLLQLQTKRAPATLTPAQLPRPVASGPHMPHAPLPALVLVPPRPILAVSFLYKGVGVLGLRGPPGKALFQLILQGKARPGVTVGENAQNLVPAGANPNTSLGLTRHCSQR